MKIELVRGSVVLEIHQVGRQIFITEGETSTTKGYFDDDEASAACAALVAERRDAGWVPSAAQQEKEQAQQAKAQQQAALQRRIDDAIAGAVDADGARVGARSLLRCLQSAPRFEEFIARVDAIDDDGDLRLAGGGQLTLGFNDRAHEPPDLWPWFVPTRELSCAWLYKDARAVERGDHNLFFGAEAGPPEPELELERTPYAEARLEWFIEERPWDRYWFFLADDGVARCYAFDGGLDDEVYAGPLAELLIARFLKVLGDG